MQSSVKTKSPYKVIHINDLLGWVGYWGIHQSPYNYPAQLDIVLNKIKGEFEPDLLCGCLIEFHPDTFYDRLKDLMFSISEVQAWNRSKKDWRQSPRTTNPNLPYDPDYDFIDLHALVRNIERSIQKKLEEMDKELSYVSAKRRRQTNSKR